MHWAVSKFETQRSIVYPVPCGKGLQIQVNTRSKCPVQILHGCIDVNQPHHNSMLWGSKSTQEVGYMLITVTPLLS